MGEKIYDKIEEFLLGYSLDCDISKVITNPYFEINFRKMTDLDLRSALLSNPKNFLSLFKDCINDVFSREFGLTVPIQDVFLKNIPKNLIFKKLSDIDVNDIGNLYMFEGLVRRRGEIMSRTVRCSFECISCGNVYDVAQETRLQKKPQKCSCGATSFRLISEKNINIQIL